MPSRRIGHPLFQQQLRQTRLVGRSTRHLRCVVHGYRRSPAARRDAAAAVTNVSDDRPPCSACAAGTWHQYNAGTLAANSRRRSRHGSLTSAREHLLQWDRGHFAFPRELSATIQASPTARLPLRSVRPRGEGSGKNPLTDLSAYILARLDVEAEVDTGPHARLGGFFAQRY